MREVTAFAIFGLPAPGDFSTPGPLVFVDGPLSIADPGLPTELTGAVVRPWLRDRPGYLFGADPREPAGSGSAGSVVLLDPDSLLFDLFLYDRRLPFWTLDALKVSQTETTLVVSGDTTPEVDRVYWLDGEAVYTVNVNALTYRTWEVEVSRGSGGAPVRVHRLDPPRWTIGEDGTGDKLLLLSRPDIARAPRIYCAVYHFGLSAGDAIASVWIRRGVLSGEPTPGELSTWSVPFRYLEDAFGEVEIGGSSVAVPCSFATFAQSIETLSGGIVQPTKISQRLTTREAELVFGESLRRPDALQADPDLVADLAARLTATEGVTYLLARNGGEFVSTIDSLIVRQYLDSSLSVVVDVVVFGSVRAAKDRSKSLVDAEGELVPGWTREYNAPRLSDPGSAPTVGLRVQISGTRPEIVARLLCSQDGSSGDAFDALPCGVGAALPSAFLDLAAEEADPFDVRLDATSFLQLAQNYEERAAVVLDLTKRTPLREIIRNECLAGLFLFGQLSSGLLGLRPWLTYQTPTARVVPVNGTSASKARLSPVTALDLSGGVNLATLEPERTRTVRLRQTAKGGALALRISKPALLSPVDTDGPLADLVRVYLDLLGGAPLVYGVTCAFQDVVSSGIEFGSAVLWSDPSEVTPRGVGFVDAEFIVVGLSGLLDGGRCALRLLYNGLANTQTATQTKPGKIPPSFEIHGVDGTISDFSVLISTRQASALSLASFGGFFSSLAAESATVRITTASKQATPGAVERPGALDLYAVVQGATLDGVRGIRLRLSSDVSWLRGGFALTDLVVPFVSRLVLSDRRAAGSTVSGARTEAPPLVKGTRKYLSSIPVRGAKTRLYTFGG